MSNAAKSDHMSALVKAIKVTRLATAFLHITSFGIVRYADWQFLKNSTTTQTHCTGEPVVLH